MEVASLDEDRLTKAFEAGQAIGVPIVNNRIAVTPVSLIAGKSTPDEMVKIAQTYVDYVSAASGD